MAYEPRAASCIDCKKPFTKKSNRSVRCPDCQKVRNREKQREAYAKQAAAKAAAQRKDPHICTRTKSCKYGSHSGCDYIGIVGHKRPCPVQGCTEYKRKSRGRGGKQKEQLQA